MATQTRRSPIVAALLVVAGLAQPALAMDVQINEVSSSIRTDEGGGSFFGPLVKAVTDALEQDAAKKRRQQGDSQPGRPA